ncbi:MAG: hypothetical protein IKO37_09325 [Prevotella sp.]|jgi:hypothetical protein|nr:hypothetical protein [Prevotella sp.]
MAKLLELTHDDIEAYILDPKHNPLPPECQEQFDRVMTAARLLDEYPDDSHIVALLARKYRASVTTFRKDVALAKEVYKTKHKFDWDFWFAWQIKDQLELIRKCKLQGRLKEWNAAKKVLHQIIGDKPAGLEDPTRMQHTNVYIQVVNNNGQAEYKPVADVHDLRDDEVQELLEVLNEPIDDAQAEDIMNS